MHYQDDQSRIRTVYVVEDQELYAFGIRQVLEGSSDFAFVGQGDNALRAVSDCQRLMPDVVLLDIQLKGETGVSVIRALRSQGDQPLIAVLTNHGDSRLMATCEMCGANTFILKETPLKQILESLRRMRPGRWESTFHDNRKVQPKVIEEKRAIVGLANLSPREIDALKLLASGLQEIDVAEQLFISPNTLKNHRKNIYKKMGFKTKTDLVIFCRENEIW